MFNIRRYPSLSAERGRSVSPGRVIALSSNYLPAVLASSISGVRGSIVPIQTIASRDPLTNPFGFSDCISGAQHGITIPGKGKHSAKHASDARANLKLCWTNRSDVIRSVLVVFPLNHPSTPSITFRGQRLGYSGQVGRLVFSEFGDHRSNWELNINPAMSD